MDFTRESSEEKYEYAILKREVTSFLDGERLNY